MRFATRVMSVKTRVRLMVGSAVAAMLITATTFIYQELTQEKTGSPASSSGTTQAFEGPAYLASQDYEADAILFDELRQSVIGVPAPVRSETTQVLQSSAYLGSQDYDQADELLFDQPRRPSASRPLSDMEIERLDYQIDGMLSAAAQTPSVGGPQSDEQLRLILDYEMTGLPNPNFTYDELMQAKVGSEPALEQ